MKRFISMLLSISMVLSLCSSSLSVSAVDTTSTVQTEGTGQVSTLFENELNEKMADLSNDFGITSVEVTDNTAVVKYHAVKDCTIVIGIYEDDGTNGAHMLSFKKAELKATETEAEVALVNLPECFYLKAYLIDTDTLHPVAKVYESPNYTKQMKDFFNRTVDDFPEERVWNLDGSDTTNFMVLAKGVKVVNMNNEIDFDNISITRNSVSVSSGADADETLLDLKKGDPFMFFTKDGVVHGIVTSVSINGGKATVNFSEASMEDMFEHIRIEVESESDAPDDLPTEDATPFSMNANDLPSLYNSYSDSINDVQQVYGARSLGTSSSANIPKINKSFGEEEILKFNVSGGIPDNEDDEDAEDAKIKLEGEVTASLSLKAPGSLKIYHSAYNEDEITYAEVAVAPMLNVALSGEGSITIEHDFLGKHGKKIYIAGDLLALNFQLTGELKLAVSGDVNVDIPIMGQAVLTADFKSDDMVDFDKVPKNVTVNSSAKFTITVSLTLKVSLKLLDVEIVDFCLLGAGVEAGIEAELEISLLDNSLSAGKPEKKHYCKPGECFNIEFSLTLKFELFLESPVLKPFKKDDFNFSLEIDEDFKFDPKEGSLTIPLIKIPFIDGKEFYFKTSDFRIYAGSCPEIAYRTDLDVIDIAYKDEKDIDNVPHIKGAKIQYEDSTGHSENEVTDGENPTSIYLRGDEPAVLTITCDGYKDHEFTIEEVTESERYTIALTPNANVKTIQIESLPNKTVYKIGEKLDITGLTIRAMYDDGRSEVIEVTSDMVSGFDNSKNGDVPVKVTYTDSFGGTAEVSFNVKINNGHVDRIEMESLPSKLSYYVGEDSINVLSTYINVYYKDGIESEKVSVGKDMISGFDTSTVGEKVITVTYTDSYGDTAETTFNITVEAYPIVGIEMETLPTKLEYGLGDKRFSVEGASIRILYNDGREPVIEPVTISMTSGFDTSTMGDKVITVTYCNSYGTEYTTTFTISVADSGISSIKILQLLDKNRYCQINGELNYEDSILQVDYADGQVKRMQITEEMTGAFDSSRLGVFPVTVSYGGHEVQYEVEVVENLKKVCRIDFYERGQMVYAGDYEDNPYAGNTSYTVYEYYLDGTYESYFTGYTKYRFDENYDIIINDDLGGTIKIKNFDHTELGIHEMTTEYYTPDGALDTSVQSASIWYSVHEGKGGFDRSETAKEGDKISFDYRVTDGGTFGYQCVIGESFNFDRYYFCFYMYVPDSESETGLKTEWQSHYDLSEATYLGGFDSSYPTRSSNSRAAHFEYDGYVFTILYSVDTISLESTEETASTASYSEPLALYNNANTLVETSYLQPVPVMTSNSELLKVLSQLKSADFTGLLTDEIYNYYVVKNTKAVDILSEDNLLFIGQAVSDSSGKLSVEYETTTGEDGEIILKPMSYIDLSTVVLDINVSDPVYNGKEQTVLPVIKLNGKLLEKDVDYVLSGDTAAKDVGKYTIIVKGIGDYTGTVEISYEIKNSSSGGTANPPSGGNTGNNGNKPSNPVIPSTSTKTWTVIVKNLVTGKTTSANAKRDGNDVVINLGSKNNDYYANAYSADGEFLDGVLIKNGTAKFINLEENNFRIEIDSVPHFDDVSSDAGFYVDEYVTEVTQNKPYAVIILVIAVTGVCVIGWKKKKDRKSNNSCRF